MAQALTDHQAEIQEANAKGPGNSKGNATFKSHDGPPDPG
jgi:hypothetical protein